MSRSTKTVSIPANVGSNLLSEVFGKISFSTEVKDLLSAIRAELEVRYNPDSERPLISLVDRSGNQVCSFEEFKKLSQYRRFIVTTLKDAEKKVSTTKKTNLVGFLIRQALVRGVQVAPRVLEQNMTKFNQLGSSLGIIQEQKERVDETLDNDWKDYILAKMDAVKRIIYTAQIRCLGNDILDKEFIDGELINHGVPKWLYNKFFDKNFTNNLREDCKTLLFPRNNYLKSISMSRVELQAERFMTANAIVLENSGGIIHLAKQDYVQLFPEVAPHLQEQVTAFLNNYQWVLTNTYTPEEVLALRETGKTPPVFREAQASTRTGSNSRPETEVARICRHTANVLGKIQATWNGILNFVIPVANPKGDFWTQCYPNAATWAISPTNSIYNSIRAEDTLNPLSAIRDATSRDILRRIGETVAAVCHIPSGSADSTFIIDTCFMPILDQQAFQQMEEFVDTLATTHTLANLDGMEAHPVTADEIESAKGVLNIKDPRNSDKEKKSGAASVRLTQRVLNELKPLKDKDYYRKILEWLMTSFKTGDRKVLQLVAAERILGEAMKHQEEIFIGEDLEQLVMEIEDEEYDSD